MEKQKKYTNTFFKPEVIKDAVRAFQDQIRDEEKREGRSKHLSVTVSGESWDHESEDEFFSDYRLGTRDAVYWKEFEDGSIRLQIVDSTTIVQVEAKTRSSIQAVFEVFEANLSESILEVPLQAVRPTIFIGHGRNTKWKDLKDHLHEKHGFQIEAYEIGARAGHVIRDILEEMLDKSSFALLVMTGEDETAEGSLRARQNVIHEIGLFQGRLGFSRAVVLIEENVEGFSNLQGVDQIRFSKNNIKETYGDVLATLRREFPSSF